MKKIGILYVAMLFFVSCVSSTTVSTTPSPQQKKTQQKQALKDRIQTIRTEQNQRIDSLIAAEDTRLQKDKNGNIIRPNWVSDSGTPLYYSTNKRSARKAIKANALSNSGALGLNLNGEGIHMGIWDAGHIFAAHDEFTGESAFFEQQVAIEIADSTTADVRDSHPTAVASIVIAKGFLDNEKMTMRSAGVRILEDLGTTTSQKQTRLIITFLMDFMNSNAAHRSRSAPTEITFQAP